MNRELRTSATQLEWVISGYMLAFAAALIIAGNLGDLLGRKRMFLLGTGLFGLARSLVAIVSRVLEGRSLGWPAWAWAVLAAGVAGLGAVGVLESRRAARGRAARPVTPLLRAGLLRIPAFSAGLGIQLAFSAGLQGFFLMFALWLQAGQHFSPLKAGLAAVAFSVGSFLGAPAATPLAQRYGRVVLASGAVAMVAGLAGVVLAA